MQQAPQVSFWGLSKFYTSVLGSICALHVDFWIYLCLMVNFFGDLCPIDQFWGVYLCSRGHLLGTGQLLA